jgi:hypothetical protein
MKIQQFVWILFFGLLTNKDFFLKISFASISEN